MKIIQALNLNYRGDGDLSQNLTTLYGEFLIDWLDIPQELKKISTEDAKMISFSQALYQLRRGNDPYSYLSSVRNYEIQLATRGDISPDYFEVQTNGCCKECTKKQGKRYTEKELTGNPILPNKDCTTRIEQKNYAWCTCWYSPHYL